METAQKVLVFSSETKMQSTVPEGGCDFYQVNVWEVFCQNFSPKCYGYEDDVATFLRQFWAPPNSMFSRLGPCQN